MLIKGEIVAGFGEGRLTGYPTANLKLNSDSDKSEPGIFAGWVKLDQQKLPGILIVGVYQDTSDIWRHEVYILDWSQDIYGKSLEFESIKKIRPVVKMPEANSLINQIKQDIESAKEILGL